MNYFRHKKNIIDINGQRFNEEVIKKFDPNYKNPPKGWIRCYIPGKKHYLTNGTNQIGEILPWINGDKYIRYLVEIKLLEKQIKFDKETNVPNDE